MNLKELAKRIDSTQIDNLETIARSIRGNTLEEYAQKYALEIATQKLVKAKIDYQRNSPEFPYLIQDEENEGLIETIIIGIAPMSVTPTNNKEYIKRYAKTIKEEMEAYTTPVPKTPFEKVKKSQEPKIIENCLGIIQFFPYQMNGNTVREILEKELNHKIAFVNLPYTQQRLDDRFHEYGTGQFRR